MAVTGLEENYVRPATIKDALQLAPKVRIADREEIRASDNKSPLEALVVPFSIDKSKNYTVVGTLNEGVIGMFGACPTKDPAYGVAWLISSEDLFKHTKQFMKECPYWISQMGNGYEYLYNWVDRRNWKSMKWLQFLGFEPKDEMKQYGAGKLPFLLMVREVKKK